MSIPNWYSLLLLAGAAYRTWRLLSQDVLLEPLQKAVLRRWPSEMFADFMDCAWCLGFWVSLAWWGAWQAWPHGTLVAAAVMAVSALVGLVAKTDD